MTVGEMKERLKEVPDHFVVTVRDPDDFLQIGGRVEVTQIVLVQGAPEIELDTY